MSDRVYYKVVKRRKNKLVSCKVVDWIYNDKFCTEYIPNQWTEPKIKGTRLFIFADLESARDFALLSEEIWECSADGVGKIPPINNTRNVRDYWNTRIKRKSLASFKDNIINVKGSLSAKKVFLLKKA